MASVGAFVNISIPTPHPFLSFQGLGIDIRLDSGLGIGADYFSGLIPFDRQSSAHLFCSYYREYPLSQHHGIGIIGRLGAGWSWSDVAYRPPGFDAELCADILYLVDVTALSLKRAGIGLSLTLFPLLPYGAWTGGLSFAYMW